MATKKEINNLLKELNISKDDMQRMYDELTNISEDFKKIKNSGKNWTDFSIYAIRNIPTGKQRVLENIEKKKQEEEEQKKAKEYEQYYRKHFEEIMVQKIDSSEELTEIELSKLTGYEIECEEGENRKWTRTITSIVELCGRYFKLEWEEGLTECQDNFFYEQPYEVEKIEYEKTIPASIITIKEWKPIKVDKKV